jgi:hypothetical protein
MSGSLLAPFAFNPSATQPKLLDSGAQRRCDERLSTRGEMRTNGKKTPHSPQPMIASSCARTPADRRSPDFQPMNE